MPRKPRTQRDPLLDAVIAKLPGRDAGFPAGDREAWLKLLVNALDVAYGVAGGEMAALRSSAPQPKDAAKVCPFRVDPDGFARGPDGREIVVRDIPPGEILWDMRKDGALEPATIVWADGTWPADALGVPLKMKIAPR